jgi:peptidoglycan/xylan/chitin deacetylase (PgdA/CDA1 family)
VPTPTIVAPPTSAFPSSSSLPVGLQGTEWISLPTRRRIVALTFDAGSGAEGVSSILSTLSREKVPGTFFLTGRWVQTHPDQARRIAAVVGQSIGNHTYDHVRMPWLSDLAAGLEVTNAESVIRDASGRDPRPLFRFPYGASDPRTIHIVNSLGYGSIRWTVDTEGWKGTGHGQSVGSAVSRVVNALGPGEIVLMHVGAAPDGSTIDADSLPLVIQQVRGHGYGFVAVWDFIHGGN